MENSNEGLKELFKYFDHTELKATAVPVEIEKLCMEAVEHGMASVCVPPCFVQMARRLINKRSDTKVCTVIAFPCGNTTAKVKVFECKDAIKNGADELDVVANLGLIKQHAYDELKLEIEAIRKVCKNKVLKLIIETSMLTDAEQIAMCAIATSTNVDFVKTGTGYGSATTEEDVKRLVDNVGADVKVKASGGIKTIETAKKFVSLGAVRIGESSLLKTLKEKPQPEEALSEIAQPEEVREDTAAAEEDTANSEEYKEEI